MKTVTSKQWTKAKLLKALKGVPNDANIFVLSSDYRHNDDSTWDSSTQASINKIQVDGSDVFLVLNVSMFD